MSMTLMVKVMRAKVGNPLRKLVLVKLADQANDNGECWPSYQSIADACEMSRSTVKSHIAWLAEHGFLRVEHRQYNNSKKNMTNVYYLTVDDGVAESSDGVKSRPGQMPTGSNADRGGSNADPSNGSNPDPESVNKPIKEPLPPSGVSAHAREDAPSDKSDPPCPASESASEAVPVEAKVKRMSALTAFTAFLVERGVSQQVARDWWAHRDGKPMTETAWQRHCQQAAKAGISPQEAAAYAAGREWRGFHAEGYLRDEKKNFGGQYAENQHVNRKLNPVERVQEAQRRRYEQRGEATAGYAYGDVEDGQFVEC